MNKLFNERATVAQSVEQLIRNQQVAGSSPASSSKNNPFPSGSGLFFLPPSLDGLEGGSRFARAKRFALRSTETSPLVGKGRR